MNDTANGLPPGAPASPPRLAVLVVEDHREAAKSLAELLRQYGHEATVAADGPEALGKARAHRPDVVLLDIVLPTVDGYEVARLLGEAFPDNKPYLIAVSGYRGDEARRQSAAAGIDLHLTKPLDPRRLQQILAAFVRDPQGGLRWSGKAEDVT
jgi:CheY-like chemotaxis protein